MQDQVKQLQLKGIPAVILCDNGESLDCLQMYHDQPLIVYLTPEHIYRPSSYRRLQRLKDLSRKGKVGLIAIDEAHLLFEWEHFRYAYIL